MTAFRSSSREHDSVWPASIPIALLLLRAAIGAIFIAHGAQKLFVYGFAGTGAAFAQMGVPLASFMGPLVGVVEFVGGLLLVVGLLTRVVAVALSVDMIVAVLLVHLPHGLFSADNGFELPLALIGATVAVVIAGSGRLSVDAAILQRRAGR